ncbi:MAG: aspartate ammonia-lyase [Candidatus Aenigmarchaeota archaeon]|nr:aspartate ammonia-lyase [Candidatus Aenigmarchaeota archaeon]
MAKSRKERDYLGEILVPSDSYYGAQTARAIRNFKISGLRFPQDFIRDYAIVKLASARANMRLGSLDKKKGHAIVRACDDIVFGKLSDQFVLDVYQAGAGTSTNMNLNEVIANKSIEILGGKRGDYRVVHPNDHVNMSQSTNDTFHSVTHIAAYIEVRTKLLPTLERMERELAKKGKEFRGMKKSGRTHGMFAVPITLGQEFSGYAATISQRRKFVQKAAESLRSLNLGGTAVGTGLNAPRGFSKEVVKEVNRITGENFTVARNMFSMTQNTEAELQVLDAMKTLSASLIKIADDVSYFSSSDVGELSIPAVQPGSSIMPGKINPSMAEMLKMVAFQVIGSDITVTLAVQSGRQELNVMMPVVAYNLLYSIEILNNAVDAFTRRLLAGVRPNKAAMEKNLKRNPITATAMAPSLGYDEVARIVRKSAGKRK